MNPMGMMLQGTMPLGMAVADEGDETATVNTDTPRISSSPKAIVAEQPSREQGCGQHTSMASTTSHSERFRAIHWSTRCYSCSKGMETARAEFSPWLDGLAPWAGGLGLASMRFLGDLPKPAARPDHLAAGTRRMRLPQADSQVCVSLATSRSPRPAQTI